MGCTYYGRKKIFSLKEADEITADNAWEVVSDALRTHNVNVSDITYLYEYYKGKQDILNRTKLIRDDILNKVTVNRANEIVNFKRGYLLTENIQYIRKDDAGKEQSDSIKKLNGYMESEGKATKDTVLAGWMYICGTGYRIAFPKGWADGRSSTIDEKNGEAPFELYTLDPRDCFVAYSRDIGNKPVYACVCSNTAESDGGTYVYNSVYTVYTRDKIYKLRDGAVIKTSNNKTGFIPIVEYPENDARLGSFEVVISILNEINNIMSNACDDIEQCVQSLLVLTGVDIEAKDSDGNRVNTMNAIREQGGIVLPDKECDAKYLSLQLNPGQTQTIINDLDSQWMEICGMPNRNGGSSTSDTGAAVQLRDGWEAAETMAMNTQIMWTESERAFLKIILEIMKGAGDSTDLKVSDIVPHFNRQNAINIQSKVQAFTGLVAAGLGKKDCVSISGIAFDVETVVENWIKAEAEAEKKEVEQMKLAMMQEEPADKESEKDTKKPETSAKKVIKNEQKP